MGKQTVLVVDNDLDYQETLLDFLRAEGFKTLAASNPTEGRRLLEEGRADLAVIDLRLENDTDERDTSGLKLAKQATTPIPIIVLTRYQRTEDVREALGQKVEGLPPAVSFVAKQEGAEVLLQEIKGALRFVPRYQQMSDNLTARITQDYRDARQQAVWSFWTSLAMSVIGAVIIFLAAYLSVVGPLAVAVPSGAAGIITEAVGILFFKRSDSANRRVDARYQDLMRNWWMDKLMAACDELPDAESDCKQRVIEEGAQIMRGNERERKVSQRRTKEVK